MRRAPALLLVAACAFSLSARSPSAPAPTAPPPEPTPIAAETPSPQALALAEHFSGYATGLAEFELLPLAETVIAEAARRDVPVDLVVAVMHVESRFHTFAVSPVGALGLMQILPATGAEFAAEAGVDWRGSRTLFDPHANVKLGIAYLEWLGDRYGRLDVALAAYNWGPGRIDRRLRQGHPVPARYAQDVLHVYGERRGRS